MTAPDQASPAGQEVPPTCYRHPDRETWVSCVRCGRHACPDCLREAAVGQQCVECVRGAGQGTRQARTAFGGRPVATAAVTWTLVGINVLLFLVELAKPSLANDWGMLGYASTSFGGPLQGVAAGQWYRLITSAFLPPATGLGGLGFLDILFNMWALVVVGPSLEQLLGRVRFLTVYLLSALGGAVAFFLIGPSNVLALGASGAIFGLFGAWFVVAQEAAPRRPRDRHDHRDQPGVQPLLPLNDRLAGPRGRADRRRADHRGLRLRAAQEPDGLPGRAPRSPILVILVVLVIFRSHDLTSAQFGA